jgi:aminopeptidase N
MGRRLSTTKTANVYYDLIYPKGSYVLHMLRWMMWDDKTGDQKFKAMMQDFVNTYRNQPATTEDFKAAVEKHMLPGMNLDGNGKMDWFFNEWVYGTALPKYTLDQSITTGADGGTVVKFKITQSGVDQNFKMLVPLYLELADGRIIRLGSGGIAGNNSMESSVPLGKMPAQPKRALINYYYDILSDD